MSSSFKFKQFTIQHDKSAMKVGTDGVLLGAWANTTNAKTILDIGTGTGLIALMLAQRTPSDTILEGVELEINAYGEALENVKLSPWPDKIKIYLGAIQNFQSAYQYDIIISNPPYFQNSQKPPNEKRGLTRHTDTLSFNDLLTSVTRLLSNDGKFNIILPYQEGLEFKELASRASMYCIRQWSFRSRMDKPIERWLFEFSFTKSLRKEEGEIVLYQSGTGEEWSDEYKKLTRDFYLKL